MIVRDRELEVLHNDQNTIKFLSMLKEVQIAHDDHLYMQVLN